MREIGGKIEEVGEFGEKKRRDFGKKWGIMGKRVELWEIGERKGKDEEGMGELGAKMWKM